MSGNTFTKYTKYTIKELESYVADPGACVQKLEWKDLVSVLPKYLGNICEGVKACLTQKIGTYDRKVDGVILAFKNTQILSPLTAIRPDSVRVHVKLRTDFYVFRPQIGATIQGTVRYVSSNYLSAVIYRVFNVTIKLKTQKMQKQGTVISFIVKAFDMKSDLPFIEGQLIAKSDDDNPVSNGVVKKEKNPQNVSEIKPERNGSEANEVGVCEENIEAQMEENKPDESVSIKKDTGKKGKKRKHTKLNGHAAKDDVQSDEDMELSINALLSGLEKEMSDAVESDPSISGVNPSKKATQSAEKSRPLKKKKKKKNNIDSLEAELLLKFAAQCDDEPEAHDLQTDTSRQANNDQIGTPKVEKVKKANKKKKKTPKVEEDDFEASIMSSILKCVAEADEPQKDDSTPVKKTGKSVRKSVRFDNTITEASFNAFDSSELLEISQLQSPALSSTLKGN